MSYRIEFELPGLPKSTNAMMSTHWTKKGEMVKFWHNAVWAAIGSRKPRKPLTRARLTLTRFSSNRPDYDGLVSTWKAVTDGLVVCGILIDDNLDVIDVPIFKWELAKPKKGKIRILVEELAETPAPPESSPEAPSPGSA